MEHSLPRILNWHKHIVIASTLDVGGSSGIGYNGRRVWEVAESLPNTSKYRLILKLITKTQKHKNNPPFIIHVVTSWHLY